MNRNEIIATTLIVIIVIACIVISMIGFIEDREKFITWCTKEYTNKYENVIMYCKFKEAGKVN